MMRRYADGVDVRCSMLSVADLKISSSPSVETRAVVYGVLGVCGACTDILQGLTAVTPLADTGPLLYRRQDLSYRRDNVRRLGRSPCLKKGRTD